MSAGARRRRFLLVSWFYPPHGGAGVQRALHLSRLAPALGWDPVVLACGATRRTPMDPSLLGKVPAGVRVERTGMVFVDPVREALDWVGLGRLARAIPVDRFVGWLPFACARARTLLAETSFDLVFSTSSPFTGHVLAGRVQRSAGCPWVADLRDPWTDNVFLPEYRDRDPVSRLRRRVDATLERRVLDRAAAITVTAAPLRSLLIERHGVPAEKVHLVRNGYDADDFPPHRRQADDDPATRRFRVLFAGNMYGEYNLEAMFRSAELLLARRALPDLELHVVGQGMAWARREGPKYPLLWPHLVLRPAVPHDRIVEEYRGADALVLSALDRLSVPGKLYEYIAAGPPVLAFVAEGTDAEALLARTGAGTAVPAGDAERGARAIEALYDRWRSGLGAPRVAAEIEKLTRQRQVQEMIAVFDSLAR